MVRIGIIGCGRILNAHLRGYRVLREAGYDNFRITALSARNRKDAESHLVRGHGPAQKRPVTPPEAGDPLGVADEYLSDFQKDTEVAVFTDYRELVASGTVDAINDYTAVYLHHEIARLAFEHGLHVLTQKPLAVSVAAARQMQRLAREAERVFGVTEVVRYREGNRALAWAASAGAVGTPQMAVVGALGGLWSPDKIVAETPWRHRKLQAGGGGAIDIGVHLAHLLSMVLGPPRWVQATARTLANERYTRDESGTIIDTVRADVDDTVTATFGFDSGALATLFWSWAGTPTPVGIEGAPVLVGSDGMVRGGSIVSAAGESSLLESYYSSIDSTERESRYPRGITDEFALQQLAWIEAIEARRRGAQKPEFETSGEAGTADLAAAFAMLESSDRGARVEIADVLSGSVREHQRDIDEHYGLVHE